MASAAGSTVGGLPPELSEPSEGADGAAKDELTVKVSFTSSSCHGLGNSSTACVALSGWHETQAIHENPTQPRRTVFSSSKKGD